MLRRLLSLTRPLYWLYEKRLLKEVKGGPVPKHLGLILDGNRRYARALGLSPVKGHEFGVRKAYEVLEWCLEMGIKTVTVWVFSTDNFKRPPEEVEELMRLFVREAERMAEDHRILEHQVRVRFIGRREGFSEEVLRALERLEAKTQHHQGMVLNIALGYGGREEIVDAVKRLLLEAWERGLSPKEVAEGLTLWTSTATSTPQAFPTPTSSSAPRGRSGFPASSFGSRPTPSSTSPTCSGRSSGGSIS